MVGKIKTDLERLLLVLIMEKKCPLYCIKIELFFIFETTSSLSKSVFIFPIISQIL